MTDGSDEAIRALGEEYMLALEDEAEARTPESFEREAEAIREAAAKSRQHDDNAADSLIGRQIGPWKVIAKRERHETPSGRRAIYIIQHRDGFMKGLRGQRLNALMVEAERNGVA